MKMFKMFKMNQKWLDYVTILQINILSLSLKYENMSEFYVFFHNWFEWYPTLIWYAKIADNKLNGRIKKRFLIMNVKTIQRNETIVFYAKLFAYCVHASKCGRRNDEANVIWICEYFLKKWNRRNLGSSKNLNERSIRYFLWSRWWRTNCISI